MTFYLLEMPEQLAIPIKSHQHGFPKETLGKNFVSEAMTLSKSKYVVNICCVYAMYGWTVEKNIQGLTGMKWVGIYALPKGASQRVVLLNYGSTHPVLSHSCRPLFIPEVWIINGILKKTLKQQQDGQKIHTVPNKTL